MLSSKERSNYYDKRMNLDIANSPPQTLRCSTDGYEDLDLSNDELPGLDKKKDEQEEYQVSAYRWVILAVLTGLKINYNTVLCSFNTLVDPIVIGFGVKQEAVIMMITMNHIIYGPVSFIVSWMLKNMKSVNVFRAAAVL